MAAPPEVTKDFGGGRHRYKVAGWDAGEEERSVSVSQLIKLYFALFAGAIFCKEACDEAVERGHLVHNLSERYLTDDKRCNFSFLELCASSWKGVGRTAVFVDRLIQWFNMNDDIRPNNCATEISLSDREAGIVGTFDIAHMYSILNGIAYVMLYDLKCVSQLQQRSDKKGFGPCRDVMDCNVERNFLAMLLYQHLVEKNGLTIDGVRYDRVCVVDLRLVQLTDKLKRPKVFSFKDNLDYERQVVLKDAAARLLWDSRERVAARRAPTRAEATLYRRPKPALPAAPRKHPPCLQTDDTERSPAAGPASGSAATAPSQAAPSP